MTTTRMMLSMLLISFVVATPGLAAAEPVADAAPAVPAANAPAPRRDPLPPMGMLITLRDGGVVIGERIAEDADSITLRLADGPGRVRKVDIASIELRAPLGRAEPVTARLPDEPLVHVVGGYGPGVGRELAGAGAEVACRVGLSLLVGLLHR